jgi:hypothetical protein
MRDVGDVSYQRGRVSEPCHMDDDRIGGGPALGIEKTRDRIAIEGVRAEAVDRFGGKGDETAAPQAVGGARNGARVRSIGVDGDDVCHHP